MGERQAALLRKPRDELRGEEGAQVREVTTATERAPGRAKDDKAIDGQTEGEV